MKIKIFTSVLLAAAMLFSATSCGLVIINDISGEHDSDESGMKNDESKDASESEQKYIKYDGKDLDKEAAKYLAELPERDYDGAVFFITTPSTDYISPDDTAESVSQLVLERNNEVEELLGISIVTSLRDTDTMLEEMKQAFLSEMYYTDLLMIPVYMIGLYRIDDLLLNMRKIPFFDINKPYFNKASSDMTSGGYSTYGVAGDASISPYSFSAVYMNKDILADAGLDVSLIYKDAAEGKWTWDKLLTYSEAVRDLNETLKLSDENFGGYYTVTAQNTASRLPDLIFKACGNEFVRTGMRKVPIIGYNVENSAEALDTIYAIYNDEYAITSDTASAATPFSEGRSAFLIDYLYMMEQMSDSKADWGMLPLPKENEKGKYKTLIANTESVFSVPVNHTNSEYAAITLSALNAASYGYIYDEYVNYSMLHYLRDNESIGMLDIILDTADFDFALAFGNAYPAIANATYKLLRDCAKSGDVEKYFKYRADAANAVMKENFDLRY